jgi:hypothetical protein
MVLTSTGLGIGTSSPTAKLNTAGNSSANQVPDIQITRSSSGTAIQTGPNLTFSDGTTNNTTTLQVTQGRFGVWNYGSGAWNERMAIDSSGNLGLGVTPSASWTGGANLQIGLGAVYANSSLGAYDVSYNSVRTASNSYVYAQTGLNATRLQQRDGAFNFFTALSGTAGDPISFTQAMTLDASGNLGIGATSPLAKLDVVGGNGDGIQYRTGTRTVGIGQVASEAAVYWGSTTALTFFSGSERMRLDSSGNLGLGVTPSAWTSYKALQVASTGGALSSSSSSDLEITTNAYYNAGWLSQGAGVDSSRYRLNAGTHAWFTAPSEPAGDPISFTQAMTLDASGNLVLGTTSTIYRAEIRQSASTGNGSKIVITAPDTGNTSLYLSAYDSAFGGSVIQSSWEAAGGSFKPLIFCTSNTERARITSGGNFKIGGSADRATTEGDKQLVLFDGTAPVGTLANGVSFYSASGEANVMDAAGNATLLSPHDAETNEWIFRSKHTPTGKVLKIDVERLLKFVNDHFGLDAVHE